MRLMSTQGSLPAREFGPRSTLGSSQLLQMQSGLQEDAFGLPD